MSFTLHSEIEALIWPMKCTKNLRQFRVTFATYCSQLVKMVSEPEEWPVFGSYLEDIKLLRRSFFNSDIVHVPRTENQRAISLAHSARKQPSFVVHMDRSYWVSLQSQYESVNFLLSKKKDKWTPEIVKIYTFFFVF